MKNAFFFFVLLLLGACTEDLDFGPQSEKGTVLPVDNSASKLWILNEGNFGWGANGSLSIYDIQSNEVYNEVFKNTNNYPLGDVAHSLTFDDSLAYIAVNNSNKIEIIHKRNYRQIAQISNLISPRKIAFYKDVFFVSDLYAEKISVFDKQSLNQIHSIETGDWNEDLFIHNNLLITANVNKGELLKINAITYRIEQKITLEPQLTSFCFSENSLWLLAEKITGEVPKIYEVNLDDFQVKQSRLLEDFPFARNLIAFKNKEFLFSDGNRVMHFQEDLSKPIQIWLKGDFSNINYMVYSKSLKELYIADAKDFVQSGTVFRYAENKTLLAEIPVGRIPGFMLLNE